MPLGSLRLAFYVVLTKIQTGVSGYAHSCRDKCVMAHDIQRLLLGGGFGFLTGQHGLVIDNLLQVRPSLSPGPRYGILSHM